MSGVLFLVHRIPYPPDKGDKIRSHHLLRALAAEYQVHLGTFVDDPADWRHARQLEQWCASVHLCALGRRRATLRSARGLLTGSPLTEPYFADPGMHEFVRRTLERERIVAAVALSSSMAQYLPERVPPLRRVVDFVDVDSDKWLQYSRSAAWPMSWIYGREGRLLQRREAQIARSCDASVFVSHAETEHFARLHPDCAARVHTVANGVDAEHFSPAHPFESPFCASERAVVFTGAMDYWANVDAVAWFAHEVLPRVRARSPDVRFWIVGSNPAPAVRALAGEAVQVTGRVPDVRPFLCHAHLAVAPLRLARGVQNKVLEAMAMARTVVASPAAIRGIEQGTPPGVMLADAPEDFAGAVLAALADPDRAAHGRAARAYVRQHFDWAHNLAGFLDLVADRRRPASGGCDALRAAAGALGP